MKLSRNMAVSKLREQAVFNKILCDQAMAIHGLCATRKVWVPFYSTWALLKIRKIVGGLAK